MSDPERLLEHASDLEARLLSSALDEPAPPDLLERTLTAVGAAKAGGALAAASAAHGAAAAKTAGGGILGAVGLGAVAGVVTLGAISLTASVRETPSMRAAPSALVSASGSISRAPSASRAAMPSASAALEAHPSARSSEPPPRVNAPRSTVLAAEIDLLDQVRSALRAGDARRALTLLDRRQREIPVRQMDREAALLRAEAEAAIGSDRDDP